MLPGVTPGLAAPEPPGVVNLTEFVFLAPDKPAKKSSDAMTKVVLKEVTKERLLGSSLLAI